MGKAKIIRLCGIFCIFGVLIGIVWAVINSIYPNSAGSTVTNDFVVLHPFLHRLEHASAAFLMFPGLFAGLLGYYFTGAVGKGWFGKILLALAAMGAGSAIAASLIETVVLQWETTDIIRAFGFALILMLLCPLLFGIAALIYRKIPLLKRILPLLLAVLFFVSFWVIVGIFKMNEYWAVAVTFAGWLILGYAVYTEGLKANEEKFA
jgi:hypothetical protein